MLAVAVSQLELALRESQGPLQHLTDAIVRINQAARAAGTPQLGGELAVCLEQLQFYDRMTQHLSHLRDFMSSMTVAIESGTRDGHSEADWERMRNRFRERLISDAQRGLLDLIAPAAGAGAPSREPQLQHAEPGSIELF